jgi:hypothetical protein
MHKNVPVVGFELDETDGEIDHINEVYDIKHMPVGTLLKNSTNRALLNAWWKGRSIPASRMGIDEALSHMKVQSAQILQVKSLGLSLSDQYWVRPKDSNVSWNDINFFDNPFSEDVGNALFGQTTDKADLNLMSPDNTSDGWLKKKWVILDNKRCLVKSGSPPNRQEPFNEILAAEIMERLKIKHVPYRLIWENGEPYSVCEDFITRETELIPAWYIMQTVKQENNVSAYQHYLNRCEALEIPGVVENIYSMLVVDFIISNTDRHLNNFGAVRNAETLEWLGTAPIYDSGTSMWHDEHISRLNVRNDKSKPFKSEHSAQIKLVKSFDFVDFDALNDIADVCNDIYKQSPFIDDHRRSRLCYAINKKIEMLKEISLQ